MQMNQQILGKGEGHRATEGGRLMRNSNTTPSTNISYQKYSLRIESQVLQVHACAWTLSGKHFSGSHCEDIEMQEIN